MIITRKVLCLIDVNSLANHELEEGELMIETIKDCVFKLHIEGLNSQFPLEWAYYFVDLSVPPMVSEKNLTEALEKFESMNLENGSQESATNNEFLQQKRNFDTASVSGNSRPYSSSFTSLTLSEYQMFCQRLESLTAFQKKQRSSNESHILNHSNVIRENGISSNGVSYSLSKNLWITLGILLDPPFTWTAATETESRNSQNPILNEEGRKLWSVDLDLGLKDMNHVLIFSKLPHYRKAMEAFASNLQMNPSETCIKSNSVNFSTAEISKSLENLNSSFGPYQIKPVWVNLSPHGPNQTTKPNLSSQTNASYHLSICKTFLRAGWSVIPMKKLEPFLHSHSFSKLSNTLQLKTTASNSTEDYFETFLANLSLPCQHPSSLAHSSKFDSNFLSIELKVVSLSNHPLLPSSSSSSHPEETQDQTETSLQLHIADLKPISFLRQALKEKKMNHPHLPYVLASFPDLSRVSIESASDQTTPAEPQPLRSKPAESKPAESKPVGTKPVDPEPAESKSSEFKPAVSNSNSFSSLFPHSKSSSGKRSSQMLVFRSLKRFRSLTEEEFESKWMRNGLQSKRRISIESESESKSRINSKLETKSSTSSPLDVDVYHRSFCLMLSYLKRERMVAEVCLRKKESFVHGILKPFTSTTAILWPSSPSSFSSPPDPPFDQSTSTMTKEGMKSINFHSNTVVNECSCCYFRSSGEETDKVNALRTKLQTNLTFQTKPNQNRKAHPNLTSSEKNENRNGSGKNSLSTAHVPSNSNNEREKGGLGEEELYIPLDRTEAESFINCLDSKMNEIFNFPFLDIPLFCKHLISKTYYSIHMLLENQYSNEHTNLSGNISEFNILTFLGQNLQLKKVESSIHSFNRTASSENRKGNINEKQKEMVNDKELKNRRIYSMVEKLLIKSFDQLFKKYKNIIDMEELLPLVDDVYTRAHKLREIVIQCSLRLEMIVHMSSMDAPSMKEMFERRWIKSMPSILGLVQFDIPNGVRGDFEQYCKTNVLSNYIHHIANVINKICKKMDFDLYPIQFESNSKSTPNFSPNHAPEKVNRIESPTSSSSSIKVNRNNQNKVSKNDSNKTKIEIKKVKELNNKSIEEKTKESATSKKRKSLIQNESKRIKTESQSQNRKGLNSTSGFASNTNPASLSPAKTIEFQRRLLHFHTASHNMRRREFRLVVKKPVGKEMKEKDKERWRGACGHRPLKKMEEEEKRNKYEKVKVVLETPESKDPKKRKVEEEEREREGEGKSEDEKEQECQSRFRAKKCLNDFL